MTTVEKLAFVEAQIRKDIPRLMELNEGVLLKMNLTKIFLKSMMQQKNILEFFN